MDRQDRQERQKFRFKSLTRAKVGPNKHAIASLAESDTISLTTAIAVYDEGKLMTMPLIGAFRINRRYLVKVLHMLIWIALRLRPEEIEEEDKRFIDDLRVISAETQAYFEEQMLELGFPPPVFSGETYTNYHQRED